MADNAIPTIRGFDYQSAVALDEIIAVTAGLLSVADAQRISVRTESEEDVFLDIRGEHHYIQVKHSEDEARVENLLSWNDFWKTLANWLENEIAREATDKIRYFLKADFSLKWGKTQLEAPTSLSELDFSDNLTAAYEKHRDKIEGKEKLSGIALKINRVFELWADPKFNDGNSEGVLKRVILVPNHYRFDELRERLRNYLRRSTVDDINLENLATQIQEWWASKDTGSADRYQDLSAIELEEKIRVLIQNQAIETVPVGQFLKGAEVLKSCNSYHEKQFYKSARQALGSLQTSSELLEIAILNYVVALLIDEKLKLMAPSMNCEIDTFHDAVFDTIKEKQLFMNVITDCGQSVYQWFHLEEPISAPYIRMRDVNGSKYTCGVAHHVLEDRGEDWAGVKIVPAVEG